MLEPDAPQTNPSAAERHRGRSGDVRGRIDFLDVDRQSPTTVDGYTTPDPASPDGGDLACWASFVCPGCGGVTTDPAHDSQHRRWLAAIEQEPTGG
jgi:hypothetical protein